MIESFSFFFVLETERELEVMIGRHKLCVLIFFFYWNKSTLVKIPKMSI